MFTVLGCMAFGVLVGYLFRQRKISIIHRIILVLIWLLLFLLGLELGSNDTVVRQFGTLGFEAILLAIGGTLGSAILSWLLWITVKNKTENK